jgi:hypothetical protein
MKRNQLKEGWLKAGGRERRSAVFGFVAGLRKIEEIEDSQGWERDEISKIVKVGKDRENQKLSRWGKTERTRSCQGGERQREPEAAKVGKSRQVLFHQFSSTRRPSTVNHNLLTNLPKGPHKSPPTLSGHTKSHHDIFQLQQRKPSI